MCTWALVYMARTKTMEATSYVPFFLAMVADVTIVYYIACAIVGKVP